MEPQGALDQARLPARVRHVRWAALTAITVLLALLVWELGGAWRERAQEAREWRASLSLLADSRAGALAAWNAEASSRVRREARGQAIQTLVADPANAAATAAVVQHLADSPILGIEVFDPARRRLFAWPPGEQLGLDPATPPSRVALRRLRDRVEARVAEPIVAADGRSLGTLVAHLEVNGLRAILRGERPEAASLAAILFERHGAGWSLVDSTESEARSAALAPALDRVAGGFAEVTDSAGTRVFAAGRAVRDTPWVVVVKVDAREGLRSWREDVRERWLFAAGLLAALGALGWLAAEEGRLRAMARVAARDERYRQLLDRAHDAVFVARARDGRILEANHAATSLYGYSAEQLRTMTLADLRASTSQSGVQILLQPPGAESEPHEAVHRRADGAVFPVEVSGGKLAGTGEPLLLAIVRDITQRKQAELENERTRSLLRVIVRVNEIAGGGEDHDALITGAARALVELGGLRLAWIAAADVVSPEPALAWVAERDRLLAGQGGVVTAPPGAALAARALREDRPVVVRRGDAAAELPFDAESAAFVPVRRSGVRAAVLAAFDHDPGRFSATQTALLVELAGDLGLALEVTATSAALRESERRYRRLFDENPMPMWVFDRDTLRFLAVNDAAVAHYGYDRERFHAMTILDIRDAAERARIEPRAGLPGYAVRQGPFRHLRADGSEIEVYVNVHDVEFAGRPGRMVLIEDHTEVLRTERALQQSELLFRSTFEDVLVGLVLLAPDGTVLRGNRALGALLGRDLPEVVGQPWERFVHPDDVAAVRARMATILAGGDGAPRNERRLLGAAGNVVWTELSARLLRDAAGMPLYYLVVVRDVTADREAARALAESEQLFRSAFEEATVGMTLATPEGVLLRVNDRLSRMLGWPREELVGTDFGRHVHPEDLPSMVGRMSEVVAGTAETARGKRRLRHRDGRTLWGDVSGSLLRDPSGRPLYFLVIVQDITARVEAERELETRRAQLQAAIAATQIGLWDWNVATGEAIYSREWKAMLGYADDEVAGTFAEFERLTLPEDVAGNAAAVARYIEHPEGFHSSEFRMRHKDGSIRWIFSRGAAIAVDDAGRAARLVGCHLDVTERKLTETRLHDALERFQLVARASRDVVWEWDFGADTIWWSEAMATVFGYPRGDVVLPAEWWRERVHPQDLDRVSASANRAVRQRHPAWRETYLFRGADGEYVDVEDRGLLVFGEHGDAVRMVGVMSDVTDRRRAEHALQRAHEELEQRVHERTAALETANRELESFSYSVSHDLRAPLRAISGFSRILADEHGPKLDAEARRLLGVVRSNTLRMGQLIDDLLAFSRVARQELRNARIDMDALARSCWEEVSPGDGAAVELRLGPLPAVEGDPGLVRQVWVNLLSNAVKFTAPKPERRVEVDAAVAGGLATFRVADNGVGFDMAYADKLFGVFQRLHGRDEFEGTGVGLALVQRIVVRHGGRIWGQGEPGAGATFWFELPLARPGTGAA